MHISYIGIFYRLQASKVWETEVGENAVQGPGLYSVLLYRSDTKENLLTNSHDRINILIKTFYLINFP